MKVLHDPARGFQAHIYALWSEEISCHVRWPDGRAKVLLGTWDFTGDTPPPEVIDWLKEHERYLYMQWCCHHPDPPEGGNSPTR